MNTLVKDVLTVNVCWVEQGTPFAAIPGRRRPGVAARLRGACPRIRRRMGRF
jgi:hypothetical protein